jgi:hypothetical protein
MKSNCKKIMFVLFLMSIVFISKAQKDIDFKNSLYVGGGASVGGTLGIYYEHLFFPKSSFFGGIAATGTSDPIGFSVGYRYYSKNYKSFLSLMYGTWAIEDYSFYSSYNRDVKQGITAMYGYRFYFLNLFSANFEIGAQYVTEKMHTDFAPVMLAYGIGIAYHF